MLPTAGLALGGVLAVLFSFLSSGILVMLVYFGITALLDLLYGDCGEEGSELRQLVRSRGVGWGRTGLGVACQVLKARIGMIIFWL